MAFYSSNSRRQNRELMTIFNKRQVGLRIEKEKIFLVGISFVAIHLVYINYPVIDQSCFTHFDML